MRVPAVGWAFFGLAVLILIICALSLGIFVGSEETFHPGDQFHRYYSHTCRYLYLTGIRRVSGGVMPADTAEEAAANGFCPVFGSSR